MSDRSIVEQIKHYQRDIVKCPDNSNRMLRCIERLTVLPVKIAHLQETGVGRSVNELRKCGGEVGAAANALVCKWKSMVKDEKESDPESEIEEELKEDQPPLANNKNNSPNRNSESVQKNREVHNREDQKKSVSSHSSSKTSDPSDSRSSKHSDHKNSNKSDHHSSRDKMTKSGYSSSSDSKYSSHKSKSDHKSRSQERTHSSHRSESECNGSIKNDRAHSKTKYEQTKSTKYSSTSDGKTRDIKQKSDKEISRKDDSPQSSSYSSTKKYDLKRLESDSSDDDSVYKPSYSSSRKRKKSYSEEDEKKYDNKRNRNSYSKESSNKRNYESSGESNIKSESDEEDERESGGHFESNNNSESEAEMSNRSEAEDNASGNEAESGGRSSVQESEESNHSENNEESEENSDSPEREIYVPVKVKREKESPPKHSKSNNSEKSRLKSDSVKNTHSSSSHTNKYKATVKKEERHESVKIKKEKIDKDSQNKQRQKEDKSSTYKKDHKSSSSRSESSSKPSKKTDKVKVKIEKAEDGSIDCESGASFGDALLGLSDATKKTLKRKSSTPNQVKSPRPAEKTVSTKLSSSSKPDSRSSSSSSKMSSFKEPELLSKHVKLEPLVDLKVTLPEITPNYKPLPHFSPPSSPAYKGSRFSSQEDALSSIMSQKNQRTKVYSGNKSLYTKVPSLFDLCIQVLRDNIEALEYTGGVPYDLLKPVLDRATADQLYQLEHYNPYLVEDTDGLWQFHCNKEFRNKKPDEFETWRELYLRLLDEREKKLVALKANITQSMAKSTPIRQTKLAYVDSVVKPPRNIARKQMKYGTSKAVKHELVSKAMVGAAGSTPATEAAVPVPAPSRPNLSTSSFPIPNFLKKKKAPLMAKTLQILKGNRFKR